MSGAVQPRDQEQLRRQVSARCGEFDLAALIEVLWSMGWKTSDVRFKSHHSIVSQASMIHSVEFLDEPPRVEVSLNLGLLSAQSPLPSYFLRKIDSGDIDAGAFLDFMAFFDNIQLTEFVQQLYPELNPSLFPDWERHKRQTLQLLNLRSATTLHWLFSTTFPELDVLVEKAMLERRVKTTSIQLGTTALGDESAFGWSSKVPVPGRRVTLFSEGERSASGQPWPAEIQQRLEEIVFPIVGAIGLELELIYVVRSQETFAKLDAETFLGYDKVQGGAASQRRIKLFSGYIVR